MKIIGLTGAKGAGKTTVFKIIQESRPEASEITLANKLKNVCAFVANIPRSYLDDHSKKEEFLANPLFLDDKTIYTIFEAFDVKVPNYDKYVRPHIGKILETPRKAAQYIGSEVLRSYDPDIHCKTALNDFLASGKTLGVVTDMRFLNESEFFIKMFPENTHLLYVKNTAAELQSSKDNHISERGFLEIKKTAYKVDNEFTIDDLKKQVYALLNQIEV